MRKLARFDGLRFFSAALKWWSVLSRGWGAPGLVRCSVGLVSLFGACDVCRASFV